MDARIAPNCANVIACERLWMSRLTFEPPEREKKQASESGKESGEKNIFDRYIDGLRIQILKQAYVMLIPTSAGTTSIAPDPGNAVFCRTAEDGALLLIGEGDIDSGVPPNDEAHWMLFTPDATMLYYWTLSRARFHHAIRDARSDFSRAQRIHDFGSFRVERQLLTPVNEECPFELLEKRDDRWSIVPLLEHALLASPSAGTGYFLGYDLKGLNTKWNVSVKPTPLERQGECC